MKLLKAAFAAAACLALPLCAAGPASAVAADPFGPVDFLYQAPLDPSDPSGRTAAQAPEEAGENSAMPGVPADAVLLGAGTRKAPSGEKRPALTGRYVSLPF